MKKELHKFVVDVIDILFLTMAMAGYMFITAELLGEEYMYLGFFLYLFSLVLIIMIGRPDQPSVPFHSFVSWNSIEGRVCEVIDITTVWLWDDDNNDYKNLDTMIPEEMFNKKIRIDYRIVKLDE